MRTQVGRHFLERDRGSRIDGLRPFVGIVVGFALFAAFSGLWLLVVSKLFAALFPHHQPELIAFNVAFIIAHFFVTVFALRRLSERS